MEVQLRKVLIGMAINKRKVKEQFGRWLTGVLDNGTVTGRELARRVGVDEGTVSRWKNRRTPIDVEDCIKVAEALNVDPRRLLVTAGLMPEKVAGVPPLPIPPPTALRERSRAQLLAIKGWTPQMVERALREVWDEEYGDENDH